MVVLSICNHKGGTGKTTSAIHLAAAFGLSGYRVLVIDVDPQGFLSRMMGVDEPPREHSALALFDHERNLSDVPVKSVNGFDLLPSSTSLTKFMRKLNKPTDVLWAKEALQDKALQYDLVLFDTAAAVTVYSLNALVASKHVVIPVTPEYQPVLGAEQTSQSAKLVQERLNPKLQQPDFLFTQVDARKRTHHHYRSYIREKYGDQVMDNIIRTSASLSASKKDGSTVFDHDPHSRGSHDYANAADELLSYIDAEQTGDESPGGESVADMQAFDSLDDISKAASAAQQA